MGANLISKPVWAVGTGIQNKTTCTRFNRTGRKPLLPLMSGGSSAFLDYWPCWDCLPIWKLEIIHSEEAPSSTTSEYGSTGRSYGTERKRGWHEIALIARRNFSSSDLWRRFPWFPGLVRIKGRTLFNLCLRRINGSCTGKASSGETYQEGSVSRSWQAWIMRLKDLLLP